MKFTKATVAAMQLPAGKSDHIEFDEVTPGFGIRIRESGRRTWVAQMRVHGRTRRLAIGDMRQVELEAARAAAKKFFAESTLGKDPVEASREARAKAAVTVGNVVEEYLSAREKDLRASTHKSLSRYLRRQFAPLQGMPIDSVTRRDVALVVADIAREHGPSAAARARSALSAFYGWALKEGIATGESNPVAFTNDPAQGEKPRERVLSPSETRAIWHSCPDTDFGRIVKLLFLTACRRQEIGSLEWSEISFDKALLTIPGHKTKNHRTHKLPLVPEAVELLQSVPRRDGCPHVFGGGRIGFTSFSAPVKELQTCLAATGDVAEQWSLHDIRRTARSEMGELGVEPWVGEQILNHTRAGIEGTYNWAKLEKQMRTALMLWADRLRAIIEGGESNVVALRV
jgi:integrase